MEQRTSTILTLAVVTVLMSASARAQEAPAAPDTSAWACSKCPFPKGYGAEAQLGAGYVDESSAKFGDYRGLDEDGVYAIAGASGGVALESGYRLDYALEDLGLDSRSVVLAGGKQGAYEFGLSYDGVPHTISDTGETIFAGVGSRNLTLPAGWVRAGSTDGMTALGTSLRNVEEGYDRDRYGLFGRFFVGDAWTVALDYKRDERSGTRRKYASFGSAAMELLRPVDDSTDRLNAAVRYQGAGWFAEAGYYASIYDSKAESMRFENPFTAPAGGDAGVMALEPSNSYNEFAVSAGWFGLPGNTAVTVSGATGKGTQDAGFVGYTLNPNIAVDGLPFANLDGDVSVMRADLSVSARPLDRLRLRGTVAYDERENESRQGAFTSIVHTDIFPIGEDRVNRVYGFERLRARGSADYAVYGDLTVGVGGEWRSTDRTGTRQEVMSEEVLDGFGRVQYRPTGWLGVVLKGGIEERDPDNYDAEVGLELYGQNPLMRKFNQAYRYRSYGEMVADATLGELPVTLGASVFYGDDSYLQSDIGIVSGLDRRFGLDLNWTVNEKIAAYISTTREKIDSKTQNSSVFGFPDWRGVMQDDYETYGAGVVARLSDKLALNLDYTFGDGKTHHRIEGAGAGTFPTVDSQLSSLRADLTYGLSPRSDLVLTWWNESLETRDWQFQANPAALPTLLGLGVDPYDYEVNFVALSLRYRFGTAAPASEAAAE